MRAENGRKRSVSYTIPSRLDVVISPDEKTATIKFAENIETQTKTVEVEDGLTETTTLYVYDHYQLNVSNRPGLYDNVVASPQKWLEMAKKKEYESLAGAIRQKRNELLGESDKEFCIDRILPDSISTTAFTAKLRELAQGEMAKYRQALRDIPQQAEFPYNVTFPDKPQ